MAKTWASSERWFLYREAPFRPLYMAGLGFQQPPSKGQLSAMRKQERGRWHIWYFIDRSLAYELARGMSREQKVLVAEAGELSRLNRGVSFNPKLPSKKLAKGLASLA